MSLGKGGKIDLNLSRKEANGGKGGLNGKRN